MAAHVAHEILVVTDKSSQQWSATAYDLATTTSVRTFKGLPVAHGCLCLQAGHTLVGAAQNKRLLQFWPLCKKDDVYQKVVCPGEVKVLAISPDGLFCVAVIEESLHIWELTAGNLMGVMKSGEEITKVQFTDDGSLLLASTRSGLLKIWNFGSLISKEGRVNDELGSQSIIAHSEVINNFHVGCGGPAARVVTASSDGTCKLWDMRSGELINTLVYDVEVTAVIMDHQETFVFVGLSSGKVLCSALMDQASQLQVFASKEQTKPGEWLLGQHKNCKAVTHLALSRDCKTLVSGSEGAGVIIHNFFKDSDSSVQLSETEQVGNLLIIPSIEPSSTPVTSGPALTLKHQMAGQDGQGDRVFNVTITDNFQAPVQDFNADIAKMVGLCSSMQECNEDKEESMDASEKISSLEAEVARLKQVNSDLRSRLAKDIVTNQNT